MVSLWLAQTSRIVVIQKAIVKSIGVKCPKCNDGDVVERKSKRIVSFMDVRNILNATLSLGISRLEEIVQNVTNILLKIKRQDNTSNMFKLRL